MEKMVEGACKKSVVIFDENKLIEYLGGGSLTMVVEVVPFCGSFTAERLRQLFKDARCSAKLRTSLGARKAFVTNNGSYIVDLCLEKDIRDLKVASDAILWLARVVEYEMFLDMAPR